MWDFEHADAGRNFEVSYTLPSLCARALAEGSADIGIVPAAAYPANPDLLILPRVAIASLGKVRSILLVSQLAVEQIRSVALDTSSLTSVALTRVLFDKFWGGGRTFSPMAPHLDRMLDRHDAALLIGDPALQVDRSRYLTWDLAEEWNRSTHLPFVFAFWTVRRAALNDADPRLDLAEIFSQSRDHGLRPENVEHISQDWAPKLGLTVEDVRAYLTANIHYELDDSCLRGLKLFYELAADCGALPHAPGLHFYEAAKPAIR
jgi:chorismate dehydratase